MANPLALTSATAMPSQAVTPHSAAAAVAAAAHGPPIASPAAQAAGTAAGPNPTVYLDPRLGIVVIEMRDGAGKVTSSIPTQRQLEAYRSGLQNPPPSVLAAASAGAPAAPPVAPQPIRAAARPSPPPTARV